MDLFSVKGKTVLITGASRGLGRAFAEGFHEAGAIVYGTGSRPASIEWMKDSPIEGRVADVTETASMSALIKEIRDKHGRLDCLINNAGIASNSPAAAIKEEDMEQMINTNFKGVFRACQAYYKTQKREGGNIINISSVLGIVGTSLAAVYSGTKGAVVQMSKSLAIEWARNDFRVNVICPGFFATDMTEWQRSNEKIQEGMNSLIPMGRMGDPKELVGAALFLASDAASYMTGHSMVVDGGITAQ